MKVKQYTAPEIYGLALVLIIGIWFLFGNLGDRYLWQDEAQTACLSRTVLDQGFPCATDGRNFFNMGLENAYGPGYLYRWHPWLPFYLTAGSLHILGNTSLAARFPFALLGFFSIALVYFTARKILQNHFAALLSAAMLVSSVPFLLLCRQSRYYSAVMFFSLLALFGYLKVMEGRKSGWLLIFSGATLLFHSQYFYVPALLGTLFIHSFLYRKDLLKGLVVNSLAIMVTNLPFYFLIYMTDFTVTQSPDGPDAAYYFQTLVFYASKSVRFFIPPGLGLATAAAVIIYRRKIWNNLRQKDTGAGHWVLLILFAIMIYGTLLLSSQPPYFRYLAPLFPVAAILGAGAICSIYRRHRLAGWLCICLTLLTLPLFPYLQEITRHYHGPMEGLADYLNQNAKADDVVFVGGYGDMPLKFHTPLIINGGESTLDPDTPLVADYIVIRKYSWTKNCREAKNLALAEISRGNYEKIVLDSPDTIFENRETMDHRYFLTVKDGPRITLYKKVRQADSIAPPPGPSKNEQTEATPASFR